MVEKFGFVIVAISYSYDVAFMIFVLLLVLLSHYDAACILEPQNKTLSQLVFLPLLFSMM